MTKTVEQVLAEVAAMWPGHVGSQVAGVINDLIDAKIEAAKFDGALHHAGSIKVGSDSTPEDTAKGGDRDDQEKADRALDAIAGMADLWAAEVDLTSTIKAVVHPMELSPKAPAEVRADFKHRMEVNIDAIARQCFLEGAARMLGVVEAGHAAKDQRIAELASTLAEKDRRIGTLRGVLMKIADHPVSSTSRQVQTIARDALSEMKS